MGSSNRGGMSTESIHCLLSLHGVSSADLQDVFSRECSVSFPRPLPFSIPVFTDSPFSSCPCLPNLEPRVSCSSWKAPWINDCGSFLDPVPSRRSGSPMIQETGGTSPLVLCGCLLEHCRSGHRLWVSKEQALARDTQG